MARAERKQERICPFGHTWREPNGKYNNKHKAVRSDSLKSINFINRKGVDFHA
ncbi:MAG TPA: hypothetical protein H9758_06595 [Candidatus Mediterraneibacter faecipullorum]|uniref:Uncharacterized protein n=1 Tax=Candidatus Mediterraneibacter faecipullorum TaxID=2838670 RepID=A0A9D2NKS8_9FIRM|nr:hypothetical protein [Candidatus Mediterraneibacter faecipullorum]